MSYAELCTTSNFTFLTGASHPEELVTRAADLGLEAIAITDRNTLAGVVRAYSALKELARGRAETNAPSLPRLIVGARLVLRHGSVDWLALPVDRPAYARLSRLLTVGKRRAEKGGCDLWHDDLLEWGKGIILIALPQADPLSCDRAAVLADIMPVAQRFPGYTFLGAALRYDGRDRDRLNGLAALAHRGAVPMVALGDVLMHHGSRRQLADVLTCMREGITIDEIGCHALPNGERRLKPAADMARMFRHHPAAVKRTLE